MIFKYMAEDFIYIVVKFPPAYGNRILKEFSHKTQAGYSLLGLRPTGTLDLQNI